MKFEDANKSASILKIYGVDGKEAAKFNLQNEADYISIKFLPPGTYFSQVLFANYATVKKIIVIR